MWTWVQNLAAVGRAYLTAPPERSAVAGILDRGGGLRVVVGPLTQMHHHVGAGERLFVVPGFTVVEPVDYDDQADVIGRAERHVAAMLQAEPANGCGGCKLCCKTLYIDEDGLTKPSHTWCGNCTATGCAIYAKRPKPCRAFECLWLKSQKTAEPMAAELRPDRCGAIFTDDSTNTDPAIVEVHIDGVMKPEAFSFIDRMQAAGRKAKRVTHYFGEKR